MLDAKSDVPAADVCKWCVRLELFTPYQLVYCDYLQTAAIVAWVKHEGYTHFY